MSSCSSNTVNLDNAQLVNIICRRGDTFSIEIDFLDPNGSPLDLTGYTWKMDVSAYDGAPTPVLNDTDFTYLGTSAGKLYVTATATVMLTIAAGQYVYGLQSTDTGIVKTWIYGTFTVNEDMVQ